jgi:hypothetical protein
MFMLFCSSGKSISYSSCLSDNVSLLSKEESDPHSLWEFRQTVAKFKQVPQALSLKVYHIQSSNFQGIVIHAVNWHELNKFGTYGASLCSKKKKLLNIYSIKDA